MELASQLLHGAQVFLRRHKSRLPPAHEDEQAFDRLYELCDPWLRWFVATCGLKGEDAKDCLQEAWTAITEGLLRLDFDGTPDGLRRWMWTIVRNKAADIRRERRRHPTKPLDASMVATLVGREGSPLAECAQHDLKEAVRQLLKRLRRRVPKLTYQAFQKHWMEGKRVGQIAAELHLPRHRIRCRLYRAIQHFQKLAEQKFPNINERMNSRGGVTDPINHL